MKGPTIFLIVIIVLLVVIVVLQATGLVILNFNSSNNVQFNTPQPSSLNQTVSGPERSSLYIDLGVRRVTDFDLLSNENISRQP